MEVLDLSSNRLFDINDETFINLKNLKHLNLSNNPKLTKTPNLSGNSNLDNFIFSSNDLSRLNLDQFSKIRGFKLAF